MRIIFILACWVFAALGGGIALLTLLPAYTTPEGHLEKDALEFALQLPAMALVLTAITHAWPAKVKSRKIGFWCVPAYAIAGVSVVLLLTTWFEQQHK